MAALLTESPASANFVAQEWLGVGRIDGAVQTRIQRPVGGQVGWVDLEMYVRGGRRKLIWVEVKVGSRLSGTNQLRKYVDRISNFDVQAPERLVLLLVPAQCLSLFREYPALRERTVPDDVGPFVVTWQDLYGLLERAAASDHRPHVNWLRKEVLGYMRSEDLEATELKPAHISALRNIDEAWAAVEAVLASAADHLERSGWKPVGDIPSLKSTYWEKPYRPVLPGAPGVRGTKAKLVWGIDADQAFAGIYVQRNSGGEVRPRSDDEWRTALTASDEWNEEDENRTVIWIGRFMNLKELRLSKTVEAQGEHLAKFVDNVFRQVVAARPSVAPSTR